MKVELADGTVIQASGLSGFISTKGDEQPGWALYLDEQWAHRTISWPHEILAWRDFSPPPDESELFRAIVRAWSHAKEGLLVEVACDGGTGRTGTVVACLAVLAGIDPAHAVSWTRTHYHRYACEVPEQEQIPEHFAEWLAQEER